MTTSPPRTRAEEQRDIAVAALETIGKITDVGKGRTLDDISRDFDWTRDAVRRALARIAEIERTAPQPQPGEPSCAGDGVNGIAILYGEPMNIPCLSS